MTKMAGYAIWTAVWPKSGYILDYKRMATNGSLY